MSEHITAGAKSLIALGDNAIYDGREVSEAKFWDVPKQLFECAHRHIPIFGEEEYFAVMQVAGDPLIYTLERHKFYCDLFMPDPRPEQVVFLYNKTLDQMQFLWSLPPAKIMCTISEAHVVDRKWRRTKLWCDAFYQGKFWGLIRKQNNITHLSKIEYLSANKSRLIEASGKNVESFLANTFDKGQVTVEKVVNLKQSSTSKSFLNDAGEA